MTLSAYFSHPIRGSAGEAATPEQTQQNCYDCSEVAHRIQRDCMIELYIPADHDEFVQVAYRKGLITEKAILLTDCGILTRRDFVLAYDPSGKMVSRGMRVEIEHALAIGKPVFLFQYWDALSRSRFAIFAGCVLNGHLRNAENCSWPQNYPVRFEPADYRTKE